MNAEVSSAEAIRAFIASCEMGASVAQVAEAVDLSVSRTRELLNKEVRLGELDRAPIEPESKTMVYFIATEKDKKPKKEKKVRTPRNKGEISASSGKGKPDAKKIINPQPTLDLKKRVIQHAGGKMAWANRQWEITVNDEEFKFSSRDLAKMTVGDLAKKVGISLPVASSS
jgi:hypothetical protein